MSLNLMENRKRHWAWDLWPLAVFLLLLAVGAAAL